MCPAVLRSKTERCAASANRACANEPIAGPAHFRKRARASQIRPPRAAATGPYVCLRDLGFRLQVGEVNESSLSADSRAGYYRPAARFLCLPWLRCSNPDDATPDELRARLRALADLIARAPVPIAVAHDAECRFISANDALARLLRLPSESCPDTLSDVCGLGIKKASLSSTDPTGLSRSRSNPGCREMEFW